MRINFSKERDMIYKAIIKTRQRDSYIKPSGEIDLSGTYEARTTRELMPGYGSTNKYHCFNQKRSFFLELKQEDSTLIGSDYSSVEGKFLSGIKGKIKGTLHRERLRFTFHTSRCQTPKNEAW